MAKILVIAYDYPPILSPEAIQVQRRVVTLAQNGHKVYVIRSHKNPLFEFIDQSLVSEDKNIKIIETKKPLLEKLLNIFYKLYDVTDRKLWWKTFAIEAAKEVIEKNAIDTIYTHSTPLVDHIIGLEMKKQFPNIKWIAHFSDPWVSNPYISYKFKWQKRLNQKLEAQVMCICDILTVTSNKTKQLFQNRYECLQNKVKILPHTFDSAFFSESLNSKEISNVVIHTGNIYGLRSIEQLLYALSEIETSLEFHFYGKIKESEVELIETLHLEDAVKIFPQIPYIKSLELISNAKYLMVVDAPLIDSPFFPSKLADYIGANKPIIALTSLDSTTTEILHHIDNDQYIAKVNDKEHIKQMLLNLDTIPSEEYKNIEYYDMKNYSLLESVFER